MNRIIRIFRTNPKSYIAKGGFRFASAEFIDRTLDKIERTSQDSFDDIVDKYSVETAVVSGAPEVNSAVVVIVRLVPYTLTRGQGQESCT